jgi:hypothetical protein
MCPEHLSRRHGRRPLPSSVPTTTFYSEATTRVRLSNRKNTKDTQGRQAQKQVVPFSVESFCSENDLPNDLDKNASHNGLGGLPCYFKEIDDQMR